MRILVGHSLYAADCLPLRTEQRPIIERVTPAPVVSKNFLPSGKPNKVHYSGTRAIGNWPIEMRARRPVAHLDSADEDSMVYKVEEGS